jgi:hypothetical protein
MAAVTAITADGEEGGLPPASSGDPLPKGRMVGIIAPKPKGRLGPPPKADAKDAKAVRQPYYKEPLDFVKFRARLADRVHRFGPVAQPVYAPLYAAEIESEFDQRRHGGATPREISATRTWAQMPLITKVCNALPDTEQRLRRGPEGDAEDYDREILHYILPMPTVGEKAAGHMDMEKQREADMSLLSEAALVKAKDAMMGNQPYWFPRPVLALPANAQVGAEEVVEEPAAQAMLAIRDAASPDMATAEAAEEVVDLAGEEVPAEEDQDMMREDEGHQPTAADANPTLATGPMEED